MANKTSSKAEEEVITVNLSQLIIPGAILLASFILSTSLLLGFNNLAKAIEKGGTGTANSNNTDTVVDDSGTVGNTTTATTDIDDDPILGDGDAKVVLVEFSDYECPFCQRHHKQTHPQIISDYVKTGKIQYVYRDFPLSFHDPMATREANAAQCVYELSGKNNETFFDYSDEIYSRSGTNGVGIDSVGIDAVNDKLIEMAGNVGINKDNFRDCLEAEKYTAEIKADMDEGSKAGVTGTPGFIVGILKDGGKVEGVKISGAQPYSVFKNAIEEQLKLVD